MIHEERLIPITFLQKGKPKSKGLNKKRKEMESSPAQVAREKHKHLIRHHLDNQHNTRIYSAY